MIQLWTDDDQRRRPELCERLVTELVWHNRRVAAERERWPVGALQMCEHLDATHPGWTVHWQAEDTRVGRRHPSGYTARRELSGYVCGLDPAGLVAAMAAAPAERHWHYRSKCCVRESDQETGD